MFYVLEQIRQAGITEIAIIISPETGYWIKEAMGDNLIEGGIKGFVEEFNSFHPDALILLKEIPAPRLFLCG